ncbi:MAG TPA: hypothetical protein VFN35_36455, partial [Ktedonobacteraceae bacterium]|nr:hypothetical protein [Ktedonobacteraceae bacterium]
MCGAQSGGVQLFNVEFDRYFAIDVLLANGTLPTNVLPPDPTNIYNQVQAIIAAAQQTPEGRARLALASALSDTPGWFDPTSPEPARNDYATQEQNQFLWNQVGLSLLLYGGAEVEIRAGGNPVWNIGVDYRKHLLQSTDLQEVLALYQQAGLNLKKDLDMLNAAPRISPDPQAVHYMNNNISLNGQLSIPVLTLHTIGDGISFNQVEQAYANAVRTAGDSTMLRQAFIHRAGHCSFTPAEELTGIHTLIHRLNTGRWGNTTDPETKPGSSGTWPNVQYLADLLCPSRKRYAASFYQLLSGSFLTPGKHSSWGIHCNGNDLRSQLGCRQVVTLPVQSLVYRRSGECLPRNMVGQRNKPYFRCIF